MPPWKADTTYQRYAHERLLSATEKTKRLNWIAQGAPEGNAANTPPPPVFSNEGFLTQTPDLVLSIPTYASKATFTHDDYVCFTVPTGLLADKKLKAFELIPGNSSIVHHALIYAVDGGVYATDTTSGVCNGPTEGLVGGYTPGALPTVFPGQGNINFGYTLKAGSDLVFAMHYPSGSLGQKDSSKIRLYFYNDATPIREVISGPAIQNWNFTIPANTIKSVAVNTNSSMIPTDISLLSVFPHMHLLGKSIEAFAKTPTNDTIKFARIKRWDFDWQEFLFFEYIKKVPAASTLHGRAEYDNTTNNHHNPNNPPIDVSAGLNTTDEMFLVYFHYTLYQAGDEFLNLDSLTYDFYSVGVAEQQAASGVKVYPNPFSTETTLAVEVSHSSPTSLYIYDLRGQLITKLLDREIVQAGQHTLTWNGNDLNQNKVVPGVYFYSYINNGKVSTGKIICSN